MQNCFVGCLISRYKQLQQTTFAQQKNAILCKITTKIVAKKAPNLDAF